MYNNSAYGKGGSQSKKVTSKNVSFVNLGLPQGYGSTENIDISRQPSSHQTSVLSTMSASNNVRMSNKGRYSAENIQDSPYNTNQTYRLLHKASSLSRSSTSPVDQVSQVYSWKSENNISTKPSSKQVFLPGDRVIFAESANAPGIPIIYRLEEERQNNPDKLNLDRRKLSVCPILEGEENLRLLNFQHNYIRKIEHISMLRKLIFLDLYDNCIEEISGLNSLKSLRVLMLGKNKIRKIENLSELLMLDVLDLHANRISKIENLSHLHQLRVLNLAGNEIKHVKNISTLTSIAEINLRRNSIHTVEDVDKLPNLQRLFLSFNNIKSFENVMCLAHCKTIIELSMDGNPIYSLSSYKQFMLHNVSSLRLLDMKRVTEEEKRIATVMTRKEEERRKEHDRLNSIKEKRRLAITNAQRQWDMQVQDIPETSFGDMNDNLKAMKIHSPPDSPVEDVSSSKRVSTKDYSVCHLAELDHDALNLYGSGSLDALDKNWGEKTAESVSNVTFKYIKFNEIVPYLKKLNARFPSFDKVIFDLTNICNLNDINALSLLENVTHLVITDQGNPITKLTLWRSYAIFRLADQLRLSTLNDSTITEEERVLANERFSPLLNSTTLLSQTRLSILDAKQNCSSGGGIKYQHEREKLDKSQKSVQWKIGKSCLIYHTNEKKRKNDIAERKSFASNYIREIVQIAIMSERKQATFDELWPDLLKEFLDKSARDMSNVDHYCRTSLERIKKSVGTSIP